METASDSNPVATDYRRSAIRKTAFILIGLVLLFVSVCFSVTIGSHQISFEQAVSVILDKITGTTYEQGSVDWWNSYIVWEERMPRAFASICAGASLAVVGVAMQAMLRNPLADPYTTGISSGAMVGLSAGIVLGITVPFLSDEMALMLNAFITGIIPALVIVGVTKMRNVSPTTVILAGLAMTFMFGAITQLIMMGAEAEKSQEVYKWMVGTLNYVVSDKIPLMAVITIAGSVFFIAVSKQLNLISMGDAGAKSLGLDTEKFRNLCLFVMSIMVAEQVSVTGVLGFVGLVVPHMTRMMVGVDNRVLVPASMVVGALLIVVSDIIARTLLDNISVGVVLSFIGGPMFLLFILRSRRDMW